METHLKSIGNICYNQFYGDYLEIKSLTWDSISQQERDDWEMVARVAIQSSLPEDRPTRPCCYLVDCSDGFDVLLEDEL